MLMTLVQKEVMQHILSVRFVALLLMCLLLIPLTLSTNYRNYQQNLVDYQESVKIANIQETTVNPKKPPQPEVEVSKLFLKPTPLSVFAKGLEESLPSYLGMTRNGITQGPPSAFSAPLSQLLGHLDFLFVVGTVFSLLALLFTFDAVAGEREAGTLRITLANPLPRDLFLWSKLIGGYLVFVIPFLVSFLFGLLVLVWNGFPLGEPEIFPRVLSITFASLLYIAVFFVIGTVISTHLDNSKTALIVAFTIWVFAVLITPRLGFLAAKVIMPTRTSQSVYMEKTAMRDNFDDELKDHKSKFIMEVPPDKDGIRRIDGKIMSEIEERIKPLEEEYRLKFQNLANQLDQDYKRETERQGQLGETFSRISPTSSLIYLTTNLTQTGKAERTNYFQTGDRYYEMLHTDFFSEISDHTSHRVHRPEDNVKITQPPPLETTTLGEILSQSVTDILLLCFFVVTLTTVAFLKFFCSDI